jgi:hypothetical protein
MATMVDLMHLPEWRDDGGRTDVVGESRYQSELREICRVRSPDASWLRVIALLRPEPHNPYDSNAVAVFIGSHRVGYLSREDAEIFHATLDECELEGEQETACQALVKGGHPGRDGVMLFYSVELLFDVADGRLRTPAVARAAASVEPLERRGTAGASDRAARAYAVGRAIARYRRWVAAALLVILAWMGLRQ